MLAEQNAAIQLSQLIAINPVIQESSGPENWNHVRALD